MRLDATSQLGENCEVAAIVKGSTAYAITSMGCFATASVESGGNVAVEAQNFAAL